MLHESYLFDPIGPDVPVAGSRWGRLLGRARSLRMVVPRSLCMYQQISCAGVPLLKLAAFARLQLQPLSPFARHGACVVRQGDVLHAWMWDAAMEADFASKHGGENRFSVVAQSLYTEPVVDGVVWLRPQGADGVEAQLWKNKRLMDSLWFDSVPDEAVWSARVSRFPDMQNLGWPLALPGGHAPRCIGYGSVPWGRNLTPRQAGTTALDWNRVAPVALGAASVVLAGWGSATYVQKTVMQEAIASGMQTQERRLAELEPQQQARGYAQNALAWVSAAKSLKARPGTAELLEELAAVVLKQGLVVRELEVSEPTVQATLVALGADAPRLTAVIAALDNHPLFYDARFVDVSGGSGFKFSWRLRSGMQAEGSGARP